MFAELNKEKSREKQIKELTIRMDNLDREVDKLLKDLDVTSEQLTSYVQNQENFTQENWQQLQEHKKQLIEKLDRELDNVQDPLQTKKAYTERQVGNNWLFVR